MILSLVQWVKGPGVVTAVAQVTAEAQIPSLAWEHPYAMGAVINRKKKREREKEYKGVLLKV